MNSKELQQLSQLVESNGTQTRLHSCEYIPTLNRYAMKRFYLTYDTTDFFFFFQAEDGIRDVAVTGVQTCALPICSRQFSWEGGAGERVQGARAAYGTCFVCPDHQGPLIIPGLAAYEPFALFVT